MMPPGSALAHSIPDARVILGNVSTSTIYRLAEKGLITIIKVGALSKVTDKSIRRYVDSAPVLVIRRAKGRSKRR